MTRQFYICKLFILYCVLAEAQVNYTDYTTPFPNRDFSLGNGIENEVHFIGNDIFLGGNLLFNFRLQSILFKKNVGSSLFTNVYYSTAQTDLTSIVVDKGLKSGYAFISTDITASCPSAGLKVLKVDRNNLAPVDSAFFCDNLKPSAGSGYFFYNHLYTISAYAQYYPPPYSPTYQKRWNLIRRIDTNLVFKNEQILGDTSVEFGVYNMRQGCDNGIILNSLNFTEGSSLLIKIDTLGVEQWRKSYYSPSQIGGCSTDRGIMGLQNYPNGYIALFNLGHNICNFYSQSIIAKLDKNGNIAKEVQYTRTGDTTLEFNSNLANYTKRTFFYDMLIKTNDGNFAGVISDREKYGFNQHENYIVILDTNLNIIHRSPPLGSLSDLYDMGMVQTEDSTFYLCGAARINPSQDGMNLRIYHYKPGGAVGIKVYGPEAMLNVYPNPTSDDAVTIVYNIPGNSNNVLQLYDMLGHLVSEAKLESRSDRQSITVSSLASGIYLYRFNSNGAILKQGRLVISR